MDSRPLMTMFDTPDGYDKDRWTTFLDDLDAAKAREAVLMASKQADYGPGAIMRAPGGPAFGVLVRLHDKVERLRTLLEAGGDPNVGDEAVRDTAMDIANYGTILGMVLDGCWPKP